MSRGDRTKPLLSLSLDVDDKWSYMKTHGDAGWEEYPSYLDRFVPIVLDKLRQRGLKITFFLVGRDAARDGARQSLAELARDGHEIGNHSFSHEPWWQEYDRERVDDEITRAEETITEATGERPRGFRGPGFSLTRSTLEVLAERDYLYDATTFPTFLGPLARAYYFFQSRGLSEEERRKRSVLFGRMRDGFQPLDPFAWQLDQGRLCEIPVTTMPLFRVPIHLSYLVYLSTWSISLARLYRRLAFGLCRVTGTQPSFLLHPLDFLGGDEVQGLEFFPGMNKSTKEKLAIFDEVIDSLQEHFHFVIMRDHARATLDLAHLSTRTPMPSLG